LHFLQAHLKDLHIYAISSGKLYAYEFKWNENRKAKLSQTFADAYPESKFEVINKENFSDFIAKE
jgi:hypothetical protein